MKTRLENLRFLMGDARRKLLFWATLASAVAGVIGLFEPLEDSMRIGRSSLSLHPASGKFVVVGIDDRSLQSLGLAPWPRRYYGELIDALSAAGVKHIYVNLVASGPSNVLDDKQLVNSLRKSRVPVTFATRSIGDPTSRAPRTEGLWKPFADYADVAHIAVRISFSGIVNYLPYAFSLDNKVYRSFSAHMAGRSGGSGEVFLVDHSIDVASVPTISAIDLLKGKIRKEALAGKTIVIGTTSEDDDQIILPRIGPTPTVFLHVLGAETLTEGRPWLAGWPIPLLLAFGACCAHLFWLGRALARSLVTACAMLLLLGPVVAERHLIFFAICPALTLLGIVVCVDRWHRFRHQQQQRVVTNSISGLPNFNALRAVVPAAQTALVAARVRNFADVIAALPPEAERNLVDQIAGRLAFSNMHALYQGDEGIFAWFASRASDAALGDQLDALHALFRSPVAVGERRIDLSITFGIDTGDDRTVTNRIASALVAADEAAKTGLRWKTFDPEQLKNADWRLSLLGRLDEAIENGEVWVAYQPKLDIESNRITGAEALVRWTHPEKGEISPSEFVLAAEQHGRIDRLTTFVLDHAIASAASSAVRHDKFEIAVNLSARLLDSSDIVSTVRNSLRRHRLPADRLTLEVTESATMANSGSAMKTLEALKALGLHISIDDYGTGLSTLEYLRTIPASEIKIDRGFVSLIDRNNSDKLMVSSTIQLAHSLGHRVIAEGVESANVLAMLTAMGCDGAQGFFIGRPMRFPEIVAQLNFGPKRSVA